MPRDALTNTLVLPLLGMLIEQPDHAYALAQRLNDRYPMLTAHRSSVLTLMQALASAGLVAPRPPARAGNRPARTVFVLTAAGFAVARSRIEALLRQAPAASFDFITALAYIGALPAATADAALRERINRLQQEMADLPPDRSDLNEVHMIEVAYWRALVTGELAWLRTLRERIAARTIEWPHSRAVDGGDPPRARE